MIVFIHRLPLQLLPHKLWFAVLDFGHWNGACC